ncbi:MAG TPA: NUDIX domain-containing protein [Candidatus Binatia bacterium]|nr:NUDIX domain-containing protein [Candidatus Binatia bacterium]
MLEQVVEQYLKLFPGDKPKLKLLLKQLAESQELDDRRNFNGHIAGDAIILSPDLTKILYIYHLRSGKWQQPGGHFDKGEDGPWSTAAREAHEETGVRLGKRIGPDKNNQKVPLHIVTGPVNPSTAKNEPSHWHHDFRYGFIAESETLGDIEDPGIKEAKWFDLKQAMAMKESGHQVLTSIERMLLLLK